MSPTTALSGLMQSCVWSKAEPFLRPADNVLKADLRCCCCYLNNIGLRDQRFLFFLLLSHTTVQTTQTEAKSHAGGRARFMSILAVDLANELLQEASSVGKFYCVLFRASPCFNHREFINNADQLSELLGSV